MKKCKIFHSRKKGKKIFFTKNILGKLIFFKLFNKIPKLISLIENTDLMKQCILPTLLI